MIHMHHLFTLIESKEQNQTIAFKSKIAVILHIEEFLKRSCVMNVKLIMTALFFALSMNGSGGGGAAKDSDSFSTNPNHVEFLINDISVAEQKSYDCVAHALKNAAFGIELIENIHQRNIYKNTLKKMNDYPEYLQFTNFMKSRNKVNFFDLEHYLATEKKLKNIFLFDYDEIMSQANFDNVAFWNKNYNHLKELLDNNYIKSFIIPSGIRHVIACTLRKIDGQVTMAISMDSFNNKIIISLEKAFMKLINSPLISNEQAVQRVIDIANDRVLTNKINLYKKYQMYLKMAGRIARSFGGINFVFDYLEDEKNPDLVLSEDLILDFSNKLTDYIHNTNDDQAYYLVHFMKDNEKRYVSKIEFLKMLSPNSTWWNDNSLFSDKIIPSTILTQKEQAKIIQSIGVQDLLDELHKIHIEDTEKCSSEGCSQTEKSDSDEEKNSAEESKNEL